MYYRLLADVVVVVHLLFIVFVTVGSLLAIRWPRLVLLHVPVVLWAALIVTTGFECPLTPLERALRVRGGVSSYDGGFVDHYLDDLCTPVGTRRWPGCLSLRWSSLAMSWCWPIADMAAGQRRRRRRRSVRRAPVPPGPGDAGAIS